MSRVLLFALGVTGALGAIYLFTFSAPPPPSDAYEPRSQEGETIFVEACAKCHGMRGEGSPLGPRLAGRRIPPRQVQAQVQRGGGGMPRFPHVRERALTNVAAYVNRL